MTFTREDLEDEDNDAVAIVKDRDGREHTVLLFDISRSQLEAHGLKSTENDEHTVAAVYTSRTDAKPATAPRAGAGAQAQAAAAPSAVYRNYYDSETERTFVQIQRSDCRFDLYNEKGTDNDPADGASTPIIDDAHAAQTDPILPGDRIVSVGDTPDPKTPADVQRAIDDSVKKKLEEDPAATEVEIPVIIERYDEDDPTAPAAREEVIITVAIPEGYDPDGPDPDDRDDFEDGTGDVAFSVGDVPGDLVPVSGGIKLVLPDGSETTCPDDAYSPEKGDVVVFAGPVRGGQKVRLVIDALVTDAALGTDIGNVAFAYGTDPSGTETTVLTGDPSGTPGWRFEGIDGLEQAASEGTAFRSESKVTYPEGYDGQVRPNPAGDGDTKLKMRRLAKTGDEVPLALPLGLAMLAASALAVIALAARTNRRARG